MPKASKLYTLIDPGSGEWMISFWGRKQVGVPGLFNLVIISLTYLQLLFIPLGSFLNLLSGWLILAVSLTCLGRASHN